MTREETKDEMRKLGASEHDIADLMEAVDAMPEFGMMSMFCCVPDYILSVGFCKELRPSRVRTPMHPTAMPVTWLGVSSSPRVFTSWS